MRNLGNCLVRCLALCLLTLSAACSDLIRPLSQPAQSSYSKDNERSQVLLSTLNCYWFLGAENSEHADRPTSPEEYSLKAGHLVGLLTAEAPLLVGLQEVGNDADVQALAHAASRRYNRTFSPLFVQGKDTATRQDVGALLDTTQGWGVYGQPSRVSELEKELSKHFVVRLTNAVTHMDICVVHLRVPRDAGGRQKQIEQNRALVKWAMRHLAQDPKANVVILGDFNEGEKVGSDEQALAVLFQTQPPMVDPMASLLGRPKTHANGGAFDRILLSTGMLKGEKGLRFRSIEIGTHSNGTRDRKRLYTDHFPVTVTLEKVQPRVASQSPEVVK